MVCEHEYLEKWGSEYHCTDCKALVDNVDRVKDERSHEERILAEEGNDTSNESLAKRAQMRGVAIGWLLQWTQENNCWALPTWEVRRKFILPPTAANHCRYVELPFMQEEDRVGPAVTFVSHCWGAPWGDLVAAVALGADPQRKVWIDIFAVRQWPGNESDLDFRGIISLCQSFVLVCTYLEDVIQMDELRALSHDASLVSDATRRQIAFFRVWCLVEIQAAALTKGIAIIMKGGQHKHDEHGVLQFTDNMDMLRKLAFFIDVANAEASVASDRERILSEIQASEGGIQALNQMVRRTTIGAFSCVGDIYTQCAACGDADAFEKVKADPESIIRAAGAGYITLLEKLLDTGSDINQISDDTTPLSAAAMAGQVRVVAFLIERGAKIDGSNAIQCAALSGSTACIDILLQAGADINSPYANESSTINGFTPLICACAFGEAETVRALLDRGASPEIKDTGGKTALMVAASNVACANVELLLRAGADVNAVSNDGQTPLMFAAMHGRLESLKCLLAAGAKADVMDQANRSAVIFAAAGGHMVCVQELCAIVSPGLHEALVIMKYIRIHSAPVSILAPEHPHELTLSIPPYQYGCDMCGEIGDGHAFRCSTCGYDIHVDCGLAMLPPTIKVDCHEHALFKMLCPYAMQNYGCDMCSNDGQGYVYHCEACGYDAHPKCVAAAGINGFAGEEASTILRTKHHAHPLYSFCLPPDKSTACGICQAQAHGWIASCAKCSFSIHPDCAEN